MAGNTTPPLVTELTLQDINKATLALSKQIQPAGSGPIVGTSTSLAQQNPTLAAGQIGYETDTKFFKIGDGSTAYNSLQYQIQRTLEVSYTPTFTGFGTPTGISFTWTRVGNRIKIMGRFSCGTNTGVTATISLPAGLKNDGTLITNIQVVGVVVYSAASVLSLYCIAGSGAAVVGISAQSAGNNSLTALLGSDLGNLSTLSVQFELPVSGWNT